MTTKQPRKLFNFYFDTLIDKVQKDQPVPEFQQVNGVGQKHKKDKPQRNKQKKNSKNQQKENKEVKVRSKLGQLLFKANNNEQIVSSSEEREKRQKSKKNQKAVGNLRLNIFNIIEKTNKGEEISQRELILSSSQQRQKRKKSKKKQKVGNNIRQNLFNILQKANNGEEVSQKQLILSQPKSSDEQIESYKKEGTLLLSQKKKTKVKTESALAQIKKNRNKKSDERINLDDVQVGVLDTQEDKRYKNMRIRKAKVLQGTKADQTLAKKLQRIYNYRFDTQALQNNIYDDDEEQQIIPRNTQKQVKNVKKNFQITKAKVSIKDSPNNMSLKLPAIDSKNKYSTIKSPRSNYLTPQKEPVISNNSNNRYVSKNVFESPPVSNKWNRSILDIPAHQKVNFSQNDNDSIKRKAQLLQESRMKYLKNGPAGLKNQFQNYKIGRISQKTNQQLQQQ